ncbi:unnamed protein product [Didymodactylos carnosus]|uniref:Endonuclease/exonuclease/phosphatase domain-containing protein n=1 Tax=Didymodactylos carnosus TaxID=1234261 RepID=A0A8S2K8B9_9BILA|nr:unnamed protein product [Didymodactylos carnosus]CAF3839197.1 unnamed protein product [Didymodactylos carnosus]
MCSTQNDPDKTLSSLVSHNEKEMDLSRVNIHQTTSFDPSSNQQQSQNFYSDKNNIQAFGSQTVRIPSQQQQHYLTNNSQSSNVFFSPYQRLTPSNRFFNDYRHHSWNNSNNFNSMRKPRHSFENWLTTDEWDYDNDYGQRVRFETQLPKRKWTQVQLEQKFSHRNHFTFKLISFNVLSQDLLEANGYLYADCISEYLDWNYRKHVIIKQIVDHHADIVCLQEAQEDHYEKYFRVKLKEHGYESLFIKRSGGKPDGCALFYKTDRLQLIDHKLVPFHCPTIELLDRDNVGLVALFRPKTSRSSSDDAFCVASTHLLFSPKRGDIKLAQLQYFLAEIDRISIKDDNINVEPTYYPIILCGDFNCQPYSPLYQFLLDGYIQYNQYKRSEISGQILSNCYSLNLPSNELLPSYYVRSDCRFPTKTKTIDIIEQKTTNIVLDDENQDEIIEKKDCIQFSEYLDANNVDNPSAVLIHNKKFHSVYEHFNRSNIPEVTAHINHESHNMDFIFYTTGSSGQKTAAISTNEQQKTTINDRLYLLGRYNLYYQNQLRNVHLPNWQFGSDHFLLLAKFALKLQHV